MIYIVHGDNYSRSRKLLLNQYKSLEAIKKEFDLEDTPLHQIEQEVLTADIFGGTTFIIINISNSKAKELTQFIEIIKKTPKETVLIILSENKLGTSNQLIKQANSLNAKVVESEVEKKANIFKFVDALFLKEREKTYKELKTLLEEDTEIFYILSMIYYGLRNITNAKYDSRKFKEQKGFVKSKAKDQSVKFSEQEILATYNNLYDIDRKLKTGDLELSFALTMSIEAVLRKDS